jgi:hypothetical protein
MNNPGTKTWIEFIEIKGLTGVAKPSLIMKETSLNNKKLPREKDLDR